MNEVIQTWRTALADAITAGMPHPADLVPVALEGYPVARVTAWRLADNLEHDQAPLPAGACEVLGLLPFLATFEDAVAALRRAWDVDSQ